MLKYIRLYGCIKKEKTMSNTLISIITPMHNASATIKDTIESVLAQTYENWEIIIVDDCSTDSSAIIVEEYCKKDERVRYYLSKENVGACAARNKALELARGRYIAFLDSDDMWTVDKLEKQFEFMKNKDIAFSYTACDVIDERGKSTGQIRNVPKEVDYKTLLKGNCIPCLTVMIDREKVDYKGMPDVHHEDYAAWLDILKSGVTAYGINEVLARYRVCNSSLSGNKFKAMKWTWDIYRKHEGLGIFKSIYYFINYVIKALLKRV